MDSKVVDLIKKLLALSKSDNEHEASLAMSKAQDLLMRHNLNMADIKTVEQNEDCKLINEAIDFDSDMKYQTWQSILVHGIAKVNFCKTIRCNDGVHILGRAVNVQIVLEVYNWIEPQLIAFANKSGYKRTDKTNYVLGMINTIIKRLQDNIITFEVNHNCHALIVNLTNEVSRYFKSKYPHTRSSYSRVSRIGAYIHGKSDGNNVSIHTSRTQVQSGVLALNRG